MAAGIQASPIGFFDSGVGGLSVWSEVVRLLPREGTVYLADNAHCPYGPQPAERVIALSRANTEFLLSKGCKLIVVACNTATAAAIDALRANYPVPFIGMEPAVKPAALASAKHLVGVLATAGTLHGRLYRETSERFAGNARMVVREVHGWVEAVERGETDTPETLELVRKEVQPLLDAGVDSLVLGCTHFPFLRKAIEAVAGTGVRLYDPAPAVARQAKRVLAKSDLLADAATPSEPVREFIATGGRAVLELMLRKLSSGADA